MRCKVVRCENDRLETMKTENIAKTVKELRSLLGLTQEQFAAKVGVTFSTVNRWENGRGLPSPLAMRQIDSLLHEVAEERHPSTG